MKLVYRIYILIATFKIVTALGGQTFVCYAQLSQATIPQKDLSKQAVGTETEEYTKATKDLQTVLKELQLDRLFTQGLDKLLRGDYQGSVEDYNQVLGIDSNLAQAHFNRAVAHRNLGNNQEAVEDFEHGIADLSQLLSTNPNETYIAYIHNDRGFGRLNLGDYKGAIEDFNQAIRLDPSVYIFYVNRAYVRTKLGDYKGAIEDLNQELRNASNLLKSMYYFGRGIAHIDINDNNGAIEEFSQVISLSLMPSATGASEAYVARGMVYLNLEDKQRADKDFNQALRLLPNLAQAYYNRGIFYKDLDVKQEAVDNLQKAAALFSAQEKTVEYQHVQERIRELQKR